MNNYIAYCGLECEACEAHIATINDDNELRMKVAREWSELNRLEREINAIEVVTELTDGDGHGNEVLERRIADLKAGRNVHEHKLIEED